MGDQIVRLQASRQAVLRHSECNMNARKRAGGDQHAEATALGYTCGAYFQPAMAAADLHLCRVDLVTAKLSYHYSLSKMNVPLSLPNRAATGRKAVVSLMTSITGINVRYLRCLWPFFRTAARVQRTDSVRVHTSRPTPAKVTRRSMTRCEVARRIRF
jgi:hypothetical protein